ncbi:hypothetical protein BAU18_002294 [Enterococcus diestrammenae]|uniref:Holin-like toxin n=1 Tax=Enterococcus diestrammenae TaxID=1155073 RepID=A0ABV0F3P1_9ENTE
MKKMKFSIVGIDMTVAFKIEMNYLELVALVTLTLSLKFKGK